MITDERLAELRRMYERLLDEHECYGGRCNSDPRNSVWCQPAQVYVDVLELIEAEQKRLGMYVL